MAVVSIFKRVRKGPGKLKTCQFDSVPSKTVKQIIKPHICGYLDRLVISTAIGASRGFIGKKSCQTNVFSFLGVISLAEQENVTDTE